MPDGSLDSLRSRLSGGGNGTRDELRCSTPDPSRYHDPSTQSLEMDGRTLSQVLPGRFGLRGVVIPRATFRGASRAYDPAAKQTMHVVDPYDSACSVDVDLADVTPEKSAAAYAEAERAVGKGTDPDSVRARATAAYMIMAQSAGARPPARDTQQTPEPEPWPNHATPPVHAAPASAYAPPQAVQYQPSGQQPREQSGLFSAFAQPQQNHARQAPPANGRPGYRVEFDMPPGVHGPGGKLTSSYHSYIRGENVVVLGFRDDDDGTSFFPSASPDPFAIHLVGSDTALLVESTGVCFPHAGETLCLLGVVQEARYKS